MVPDPSTISNLQEAITNLGKVWYLFLLLNLTSGHWQRKVNPHYRQYNVFFSFFTLSSLFQTTEGALQVPKGLLK